MSKRGRRPRIREGTGLVLHSESGGCGPMHVVLSGQDGDLLWIKGSCFPLQLGDVLLVERSVAGDARYMAPAEIEAQSPDRFALRIVTDWERQQQREFVRIPTRGIPVRIVRPARTPPGGVRRRRRTSPLEELTFEMLDLSAGGLRLASRGEIAPHEEFVCHFELPGNACYALPAHVVRVEPGRENSAGGRWAAARFIDIDESHRSALLRWVFREQVSRHRRHRTRR